MCSHTPITTISHVAHQYPTDPGRSNVAQAGHRGVAATLYPSSWIMCATVSETTIAASELLTGNPLHEQAPDARTFATA